MLCRIDGSLGIERIEDGLDEQCIHTAFNECFYLFVVGFHQFVVGDASLSGVIHIGADGACLVGRANGTYHKAGLGGSTHGIGLTTCNGYSSKVDLAAQMLATIIGHRDALRIEGAGLDDVDAHTEVAAMNIGYHLGLAEAEQVVVALLQTWKVSKTFTAEVRFGESELLYHSAHGTVENQDALLNKMLY